MRNNQPVTQKEISYPADVQLITTTDLRGIITFVNDDFCKVSGFSREELVGQNHNIIRHPDMPEGAFKDLWKTVQAGRSWKGMVKNRCKNGDHYWVDAFVSPIKKKGKIVEFQSIRQLPDAASRKRAEEVYSVWKQTGELPAFIQRGGLSFINRQRLALGLPFLVLALVSGLMAGWAVGLTSLIAMGFALALTQWSSRRFNHLSQEARKIAKSRVMRYIYTGDLSEVGLIHYSLRTRTSELRASAARMSNSAFYLNRSKQKSDEHVQEAYQAVVSQKEEVTLVSKFMQELSLNLGQVSAIAAQTAGAASESRQATLKGRDAVGRMLETIHKLAHLLDDSSQKVESLAAQTDRIGKMTEVISDVAEQTNLLALNAAIEAARAGEAGRGFAVVADEVRSLAQRTHESTLDIKGIIQALVEETQATVDAIRQGTDISGQSVQVAEETDAALETIFQDVSRISELSGQVETAMNRQEEISQDTLQQMEQLDSSANEAILASNRANEESKKLGGHIDKLTLLATYFIDNLNQQRQR